MALLQKVVSQELTPARLWPELDVDTRRLAASSIYEGQDRLAQNQANQAIAGTLRFRPAAVTRLSRDKRIDYLVSRVRPDESLATSLLMSLHLTHRTELLEAFLNSLDIPQNGGLIDENYDFDSTDRSKFKAAVELLSGSFPETEVEVYVASLIAMEPDAWGELADHMPGK